MSTIIKHEEVVTDIEKMKEIVSIAIKSGNYGAMGEMTMLNIMLSARDLGISPYKALNGGFYVVNGKIAMSTSLMTDRIRKEGHSVKITEWTSQKCVIIGIRKDNQDSVKLDFTWEDAVAAGLTNSPTWKRYPKAMLYNRAMSMLARVLFPDVVGNCYSEDEGREIAESSKRSANHPITDTSMEEAESEEREPSIDEMVDAIVASVSLEEPAFLEEYIKFCMEKVSKPIYEVVKNWIKNPAPFKKHYAGWVAKKKVEEITLDDENAE